MYISNSHIYGKVNFATNICRFVEICIGKCDFAEDMSSGMLRCIFPEVFEETLCFILQGQQ
jgi:hypothetical protein